MQSYLRQATASQSRTIGPFLDDTDFKTPKTALTIANTDIKLVLADGTAQNKNSGGGTHKNNGCYNITFNATDVAQVGELHLSSIVTGALAVFSTYVVVEEAVYDALFGASAAGFGTAQTGDSFAVVNSGTFGNSALKTLVDAAVAQTLATALRSAVGLAAANADTQLAALAAALVVANAKVANLPAAPAAVSDIPTAAQNADKLLGRDIEGGADGGRTVTQTYQAVRNGVDCESTPGTAKFFTNAGSVSFTMTQTTNPAANPTTKVIP